MEKKIQIIRIPYVYIVHKGLGIKFKPEAFYLRAFSTVTEDKFGS